MTSRYVGWMYLFFVTVLGVIFGSLFIQLLPHASISAIVEEWSIVFSSQSVFTPTTEIILNYYLYNLKFFALMFVFGITVIGYPVVIIIHFVRSFLIGTTVQLFLLIWETHAYLYILVWIVPSAIIILFASTWMTYSFGVYSYGCYLAFKEKSLLIPYRRLFKSSVVGFLCLGLATVAYVYLSPFLHTLVQLL